MLNFVDLKLQRGKISNSWMEMADTEFQPRLAHRQGSDYAALIRQSIEFRCCVQPTQKDKICRPNCLFLASRTTLHQLQF